MFMLQRYRSLALFLLVLTVASLPQFTHAVELVNPLGDVVDPREFIGNVIKGMMSIIGSISLFMFVYGGFLWVTSLGEEKRVDRGKKIMTWAVMGLAVIASAYVIVNAIILGLVSGSATGSVTP